MIRGGDKMINGCGVLWIDPPLLSDCYYFEQKNRFREQINIMEGESLGYTVTYNTIRTIFGDKKYRKRTTGPNTSFWDVYDRKQLMKNLSLAKEEDKYLEYS